MTGRLILGRLVASILTLWAVTLVIFLMIHAAPGDPAQTMLGSNYNPVLLADLKKELGLEQPLHVQYFRTMQDLLRGDLGRSMSRHVPNRDLILERIPVTATLVATSIALSLAIAIPLGILWATRPGSWASTLGMLFVYAGQSAPSFWTGIILIIVFAVQVRVFPVSGFGTPMHLVLPASALAFWLIGMTSRLVAAETQDQLGRMYVLAARSKGLTETRVIIGHVFRNTLIPLITLLGLQFGGLMGGAVAVEWVFGIPGIARLLLEAVGGRDYTLVQATVLTIAVIFVGVNLLVDIAYIAVDPRVRHEASS
jgi:ABC-type dipeptide/oligopeptide/nickel transport system permease component